MRCVKPDRADGFSFQNLNLTYGVHSAEKNFVLTLVYYLSDSIKRCDEPDDYRFAVLFGPFVKTVSCVRGRSVRDFKLTSSSPSPHLRDENILDAIHFYYSSERHTFSDTFKNEHDGVSLYEQNDSYIDALVPQAPKSENHAPKVEQSVPKKSAEVRRISRKKQIVLSCVFLTLSAVFFTTFALSGFQSPKYLPAAVLSLLVSLVGFISCGSRST